MWGTTPRPKPNANAFRDGRGQTQLGCGDRRLQDEVPKSSRYLADGGVWWKMRRRLYRFMYERMKRSARKHLTVTRFPTVAWDPSSGDDPPRCDRIDVTTEADGATTWRDLLPTEVARPRKRARLHDSTSRSVGACDSIEGAQMERTGQRELYRRVNKETGIHQHACERSNRISHLL